MLPDEPAGVLFLVVGPSGAGKDTMIDGARAVLAADPRFVFPRRIVTRPEGQWEKHDSIDDAAFDSARAQGEYALSWQAHGLRYALPGSIRDALALGKHVVVNASRSVIAEARTCFPDVRVVLVTAPAETLVARIAARGRDAGVSSRLDRAAPLNEGLKPDHTIINDRSPDEGIAAMVACLTGEMPSLLRSSRQP